MTIPATMIPSSLTGLDAATTALITADSMALDLPAGARVFEPGRSAEAYLIITRGSVRVQLTARNGRVVMLYRVEAGESCVLTTSSLLDSEAYAAEALCETDVSAIALPKPAFRRLLGESTAFRDAVLAAYAARVTDLILTFEGTHLHRLDSRLAQLLLARAVDGHLNATHQDIAAELGTAREVVSRTLKRFEREGLIRLSRGAVTVLASGRLRSYAANA